MKISRFLAIATLIPITFSAAEGADAASTAKSRATRVGVAYDAAGLGDRGVNDMVKSGVRHAAAEYRIKVSSRELSTRGRWSDPAAVLTKLTKHSDLVITVGFGYQQAAEALAAENPDTNYVVLGGIPSIPQVNLLGTSFANNEGSFLVGAAAANESLTDKVGFIGGVDIPPILEFQAGYVAGVGYQDPNVTVDAQYVSFDFTGFNDPARAYEIATSMYAAGVDVIFHAAGGSGIGVFEAARDYSQTINTQVWAIGVDTDQYRQVDRDLKRYILTSMVARFDVVVHDVIASQALGAFTGGQGTWDLRRNGVDYATSGGFVDDFIPTLEGIKQLIIDGQIVVPTTL